MASVYVEIEINASRERVWEVLMAKQSWKEWNSFFFDCDSSLPFQTGEVVCLGFRRHPGESETLIEPLCTRVQRNVCLSWVSEIPGFRSEQVFELQEIGFGWTKYTHRQDFSGFLCKVFFPFIRQDEQKAMLRMARDLKRFMERKY
ncbi:MAG TPA: SRPBCC domain-containing protein [Halomicronema sp.]